MVVYLLKLLEKKINDFFENLTYIPKNSEIKDYDHKGKMIVFQDLDLISHMHNMDLILGDFYRIRQADPHANYVVYDLTKDRNGRATEKRRYILSINAQYVNVRCVGDPNKPES